MNGEISSIKIHFERGGTLKEFKNFFEDLENAYNHLYALTILVEEAKKVRKDWDSKDKRIFPRPYIKRDGSLDNVENLVSPEDRIRLSKIVIESPGWAEIIASLNPLEAIRKYLNDRHERKKDKEWRNDQEKKSMQLDNKIKEAKFIREATKALKEVGYSEIQIRRILHEHYHMPLEKLNQYQDSELIEGTEE